MSSLASLVATDGSLRLGVSPGPDVRVLQIALSQAGYRVDITPDGSFTQDTDYWLKQFEKQHDFDQTGVLDAEQAEVLDQPSSEIIKQATPLVSAIVTPANPSWPMDDTASLIDFYGKPWEDASLLVPVPVPFEMTFRNDDGSLTPIHHISFNKKAASALETALNSIASAAKTDPTVLKRVTNFSGSYNYRPIRGSSRLSEHAFGAAIDFDSEHLPMGTRIVDMSFIPQAVVAAFDAVGAFWGNNYRSRPDAMHWGFAHE